MTMNGGIMESQRQAAAWLSGAPISTFAGLPAPSAAPRAIYRVSDANNALLESDGNIWRPLGGRQVLAMRAINPVTVQNLSGEVAETIGPFPGGLVRAGMQVNLTSQFLAGAVGTGVRVVRHWLGPASGPVVGGQFAYTPNITQSALTVNGQLGGAVYVQSDVSANHIATPGSTSLVASPTGGYLSQNVSPLTPTVDFSQPWTAGITLQSAAETAVAISTATWAAGVATYNTSAAHTLAVGDKTTIADVSLAGYNGVVIVASIVDTDTFTVAMASDPGGSGTGGTSSRISNMKSQSYVLELVG